MAADGNHSFTPRLRPGSRLVHGREIIFNLDLYGDACAREEVEEAPADLSGLSDDRLLGLRQCCIRLSRKAEDETVSAVFSRVMAEFSARGMDTRGVRVVADPELEQPVRAEIGMAV